MTDEPGETEPEGIERRGVLLRGLTTMTAEGVLTDDIFLPYEIAATIPPDVLAKYVVRPEPLPEPPEPAEPPEPPDAA